MPRDVDFSRSHFVPVIHVCGMWVTETSVQGAMFLVASPLFELVLACDSSSPIFFSTPGFGGNPKRCPGRSWDDPAVCPK